MRGDLKPFCFSHVNGIKATFSTNSRPQSRLVIFPLLKNQSRNPREIEISTRCVVVDKVKNTTTSWNHLAISRQFRNSPFAD